MVALNPKFRLKSPKSKEETLILLKLHFDYEDFTYSINRKVHPDHWDSGKGSGRVIVGSGNTKQKDRLREINTRINDVESAVNQLSIYYLHNKIELSKELLRKDLNEKLEKKTKSRDKTEALNDYIERHINEMESGDRLTDKGERYASGTIKNYRGFQTQFNNYQNKRRKELDFKDITEEFYDDFIRFFIEKNYQVNTIGRHIKILKTIMETSHKKRLHQSTNYKNFKVLKEEVVAIYLSLKELEAIYKLDLKDDKEKELVRDVFLIGAFSALRVSDYTRIKPEHLKKSPEGHLHIDIKTKKTGERVLVPIWHWIFEELLEKYNNNIPYVYDQKINKLIKKIGAKAEINEPIELEKMEKGRKVPTKIPKHKLIVTHTARRSGATNMYKHGIDSIDIMKMTGHKTESAFLSYIRVSKEETLIRIMKHRIEKPLNESE